MASTKLQELSNFTAPDGYLADRVIMVTGASRGIGAALSKGAARLGAKVVMLARTVKDMEAIADEIVAENKLEPSLVPFNLEAAGVDDYATVAGALEQNFGRLDGLILNAGQLGDLCPLSDYDPVTWAKVFQVNVHSQVLLLQATLALLRASQDASIVFTSSSVGRQGRAYWGAYAVSKFATEGMMQTLADELDNTNIRANAVNPGRTRTQMRAEAYPAEDADSLPLPEDIMLPFLFLLGKSASHLNGLSIDAQ